MGTERVHRRAHLARAVVLLALLLPGCGGKLVVGDVNVDAAAPQADAAAPQDDATPADDAEAPPLDGGAPDVQAADGPGWYVEYANRLAGVRTVHGVAENDVWALGDGWPSPRHWDGAAWTDVPGGPTDATAVFAVATNDVWTNGTGGPWHWDGGAWTRLPCPGDVTSIWGLAADDVWAMAGQGYHWDGTSWSPVLDMWGTAVSGVASDDVWAVGPYYLRHWDGVTVISVAFPIASYLRAVLALATNDVWVAGNGAFHWDGASWTELAGAPDGITTLAGRTPAPVWAATEGRDGPGWYDIGGVFRLDGVASHSAKGDRSVWVTPAGEAWGFAQDGLWLRHDGSDWNVAACGTGPARGCAVSETDVWLAQGECTLHRDAVGWSSGRLLEGGAAAAWCRAPGEAWLVAIASACCDMSPIWSGALRWTGTEWAEVPGPWSPDSYDVASSVWGTASDDVWVVTSHIFWAGIPATVHWDGAAWTLFPVDGWNSLAGGWSSARDDAWLVGEPTSAPSSVAVLHWDGASWDASPTLLPVQVVGPAIWGSSSNDVWVVGKAGAGGAAAHWDGAGWQAQGPPCVTAGCPSGGKGFDSPALSVTGTAADDVWVLVGGSTVWHWDGTAWQQPVAPDSLLPNGLTSISAAAPGSVWGFGTDVVVRIRL